MAVKDCLLIYCIGSLISICSGQACNNCNASPKAGTVVQQAYTISCGSGDFILKLPRNYKYEPVPFKGNVKLYLPMGPIKANYMMKLTVQRTKPSPCSKVLTVKVSPYSSSTGIAITTQAEIAMQKVKWNYPQKMSLEDVKTLRSGFYTVANTMGTMLTSGDYKYSLTVRKQLSNLVVVGVTTFPHRIAPEVGWSAAAIAFAARHLKEGTDEDVLAVFTGVKTLSGVYKEILEGDKNLKLDAAISSKLLGGPSIVLHALIHDIDHIRNTNNLDSFTEAIREDSLGLIKRAQTAVETTYELLDNIFEAARGHFKPAILQLQSTFINASMYTLTVDQIKKHPKSKKNPFYLYCAHFVITDYPKFKAKLRQAITAKGGSTSEKIHFQFSCMAENPHAYRPSAKPLTTRVMSVDIYTSSGKKIGIGPAFPHYHAVLENIHASQIPGKEVIMDLKRPYKMPVMDTNLIVYNFTLHKSQFFRARCTVGSENTNILVMVKFDQQPLFNDFARKTDTIIRVNFYDNDASFYAKSGSKTNKNLISKVMVIDRRVAHILAYDKTHQKQHKVFIGLIAEHLVTRPQALHTGKVPISMKLEVLEGGCYYWDSVLKKWDQTGCTICIKSTQYKIECSCQGRGTTFAASINKIKPDIYPSPLPTIKLYKDVLKSNEFVSRQNMLKITKFANNRLNNINFEAGLSDLTTVAGLLNADNKRTGEKSYSIEEQGQMRDAIVNGLSESLSTTKDLSKLKKTLIVMNTVAEGANTMGNDQQVNAMSYYKKSGSLFKNLIVSEGNKDNQQEVDRVGTNIVKGGAKILSQLTVKMDKLKEGKGRKGYIDQILNFRDETIDKAYEIGSTFLESIDDATSAMLYKKTAASPAVFIKEDGISVRMKKLSIGSKVDSALTLQDKAGKNIGSIQIEDTTDLQSKMAVSAKGEQFINFKVFKTNINILPRGRGAADITTGILGVDLKTKDGKSLPIKDLNMPILLSFPNNEKNIETSIGNMSVNVNASGPRDEDVLAFKFDLGPKHSYKSYLTIPPSAIPFYLMIKLGARTNLSDFKRNSIGMWSVDPTSNSMTAPPKPWKSGAITVKLNKIKGKSRIEIFGSNTFTSNTTAYIGTLAIHKIKKGAKKPSKKMAQPKFKFTSFSGSCFYWDENKLDWKNDGCQMEAVSNLQTVKCACNHLSSFAGSFFAKPNEVDLIGDLALIVEFYDNPVSICLVLFIWFIFVIAIVWGRHQDVQDQLKLGVVVLQDNEADNMYGYLVLVHTGWRAGAGTTANIALIVVGSSGQSSTHRMFDSKCTQRFNSGSEDCFLVTTRSSLGDLKKLDIWHDCYGSAPAWFLIQVVIRDLQSGVTWYFVCNDWMSPLYGLESVHRDIIATGTQVKQDFAYVFNTRMDQDLRDKHLWVSIFSRPPETTFTRPQRIVCALSFLMTAMLTNMMFYGQTEDASLQLGMVAFQFDFHSILVGIESALVAIPINMLLVMLFRAIPNPPSTREDDGIRLADASGHGSKKRRHDENDNNNKNQNCISAKDGSVRYGRQPLSSIGSNSEEQTLISSDQCQEIASLRHLNCNNNAKRRGGDKENGDDRPSKKLLPASFIYVAWFIALASSLFASYVVILYGLRFGYAKSTAWLISFLTTFSQSAFVVSPIKVVTVAAVVAVVFGTPVEPLASKKDGENSKQLEIDEDYIQKAMKRKGVHKKSEKEMHIYKPPTAESIEAAATRLIWKHHFQNAIIKVIIYILVLSIILILVFTSYKKKKTTP